MSDSANITVAADSEPCPRCGYDLRGHPDDTRCPECGTPVIISAVVGEMSRWIDLRLLDLWSIAILQIAGGVAVAVSIFAISRGQYVAIFLGMIAGLYVTTAVPWLFAVAARIAYRQRRGRLRQVHALRRAQLLRWLVANLVLTGLLPLVILAASKL